MCQLRDRSEKMFTSNFFDIFMQLLCCTFIHNKSSDILIVKQIARIRNGRDPNCFNST